MDTKGYIRHSVAGDGDCGYTAFGITRSEAFSLLIQHIAAIQSLLIPVIKEWLLDERFIDYLKMHQHIQQNTSLDYIQQHLDQYANDLTIIAAFIDFDVRDKKIDGGWAHPATLQAFAHIQGIELHIWIMGDNQQLIPHRRDGYYDYSCYQPPNATQRVDLLFVNNNHFERLSFEGYKNDYPSDTDDVYPIQRQVPKLSYPSLDRQQVNLTQQPSIRDVKNSQTIQQKSSRQIESIKQCYQQLSKLLLMFQSALNQQHIHNIAEEITQHLLPLINQIYKEVNETEANLLKMQQDKSIKDYIDQLHEYEKIFQGELDLMMNRTSNTSIYASLSSEASEYLVKQLNELKKQCACNSIDVQFKTDILANLPPRNEVFTGRIEEMRQIIDQLQNQQHVSVIKQSLTGTGGVGKTQLALQFAHLAYQQKSIQNYGLQYDAIAWLNGNDPPGTFINLAETFKIDTEQFKGAELIYQIYRRLSEIYSKVLLIFDDVHNQDAIEDYLPHAQKHVHQFECHVLMTSRSQIWNKNQISEIVIENFNLEEAREYIQKIIQVSDEEAEELANLLNCFPLALSQAVAYIQQTNIRVEEYIKRYQSSQQKELLEQLPRIHDYYRHQYRELDEGQIKTQAEYAQTVFTTWYVSIALLTQQAELTGQGNNAEEILNICAYFAPQGIPYFLIQDVLKITNTELTDCLIALKNYSLIVPDNQESYRMHALLQEVVRLHLKEVRFNHELLIVPNSFQLSELSEKQLTIDEIKLSLLPLSEQIQYMKNWLEIQYKTIQEKIKFTSALHNELQSRSISQANQKLHHYYLACALCLHYRYNDDRENEFRPIDKIMYPHVLCILNLIVNDGSEIGLNRLRTLLLGIGNYHAELGSYKLALSWYKRGCEFLTEKLGEEGWYKNIFLASIANTEGALGNQIKKRELLQNSLSIFEKHLPKNHITIGKLLVNLGIAEQAGDLNESKRYLERALEILKSYYDLKHSDVAIAMLSLAEVESKLGNHDKAAVLFQDAFKIIEELKGRDSIIMAWALETKSKLKEGDYIEQEKILREVLDIKERHYGDEHIEVAKTLNDLGGILYKQGKLSDSKELLEKSYRIHIDYYGDDHIALTKVMVNRAVTIGDLGETEKKIELLERAHKLLEQYYGPDHVEVARTLTNLANAIGPLGDACEKRRLLERALEIFDQHYGPDHIEVATVLANLGTTALVLGKMDESIQFLERALAIKKAFYKSQEHIEIIITQFNLISPYLNLGETFKAYKLAQKVLRIFQLYYGEEHENAQKALQLLKICEQRLNKVRSFNTSILPSSATTTLDDHTLTNQMMLQQQLRQDPKNETLLLHLAYLHYQLKQLDQAVQTYHKVLEINNQNVTGHHRLAWCAWLQGNQEKTEEHFGYALSLEHHTEIPTDYACFLYAYRRIEEAISMLSDVIQNNENTVVSYSMVEQSLLDATLQQRITSDQDLTIPCVLMSHYLLCRCYEAQHNEAALTQCLAAFKEYLVKKPNELGFWLLQQIHATELFNDNDDNDELLTRAIQLSLEESIEIPDEENDEAELQQAIALSSEASYDTNFESALLPQLSPRSQTDLFLTKPTETSDDNDDDEKQNNNHKSQPN